MANVRLKQSNAEKVARVATGLETDATNFVMSTETADELIHAEKMEKFDTASKEEMQKFDEHVETLAKTAAALGDLQDRAQIKPLHNYVIIKPYETNPFQKITRSSSGIITDLGGMTPTYKSNETGDWEEEEQFIRQGVVQEIGPEVKYLEIGDSVMWSKNSEIAIPFYRAGLLQVNEQRVICVINTNLNERFNKYNKNGK